MAPLLVLQRISTSRGRLLRSGRLRYLHRGILPHLLFALGN
jgi:hypothetical protein